MRPLQAVGVLFAFTVNVTPAPPEPPFVAFSVAVEGVTVRPVELEEIPTVMVEVPESAVTGFTVTVWLLLPGPVEASHVSENVLGDAVNVFAACIVPVQIDSASPASRILELV